MRKTIGLFMLAAGFVTFNTAPVLAGSTGLHAIHKLSRERGRSCFYDHFHYGVGQSEKSKAAARREAIRKWADFVSLEYGTDWSRWQRAVNKRVECTSNHGYHRCQVSARPCR